jgi:hypothetical protein
VGLLCIDVREKSLREKSVLISLGIGMGCASSTRFWASVLRQVRLWDVRQLARPLLVSEAHTGGGNWRLRWQPQAVPDRRHTVSRHRPAADDEGCGGVHGSVLLAACMYAGFALLRVRHRSLSCTVTESAAVHGSLSAGSEAASGLAGCQLDVVARYNGHGEGSIAYGADWVRTPSSVPPTTWDRPGAQRSGSPSTRSAQEANGRPGCSTPSPPEKWDESPGFGEWVATCSFYNKLVHVWSSGQAR